MATSKCVTCPGARRKGKGRKKGKVSAPMLMHTHSASRPWRLAPSTPWETDHLARATRCVDLAVAAPAGTPGEPADTRSGRSQQCPQHLLLRQRLILLYGGATTVVARNRSCGEERCFHHPVPLIAHMRKPLLLIAHHAGAGACTPRTGRVSPPTRCPTP